MNKKTITKNNGIITYQLPQPCLAKYLVVIVDRGITSEIRHFLTLEEAKIAFGEIANDYGYTPEEINRSDYYGVSIWEWTEDRYEKIYFCT